jgi:2-oxoglutarate ferredoxin oxidoreductase subunit alpha
VVLSDAAIAHMRERLTLPSADDIYTVDRPRIRVKPKNYRPFRVGYSVASKVPEMDTLGSPYATHVTGLTHDERGFPVTTDPEVHMDLVIRLYEKLTQNFRDLIIFQTRYLEDADEVVVSFGISARSAERAVEMARGLGRKVGFVKLVTIWPFPRQLISKIAPQVRKIIVAEMNMGQLYHKVTEYAYGNCQVELISSFGGRLIAPEDILRKLMGRELGKVEPQ